MDRQTAEMARNEVLQAMDCLNHSLSLTQGHFPDATYEQMRRTVGIVTGRLDTEFLTHIFALYPDLDDVSNPGSVKRGLDGSLLPTPERI